METVEVVIIVLAVLAVIGVAVSVIVSKKKGKPSCCSDCCGCPHAKECANIHRDKMLSGAKDGDCNCGER